MKMVIRNFLHFLREKVDFKDDVVKRTAGDEAGGRE